MKSNILVLATVILVNIFAPQANAFFGFGEGTKTESHPSTNAYGHAQGNTLNFWEKTVALFEKAGYPADSYEVRHAQENLRRVQTLHGQHKGHKSKVAKQVTKEKRKSLQNKEREAFLKGKKSGEDHERRLLKKKAEEKSKKTTKTTETKTPRKKRVKKVVKEA